MSRRPDEYRRCPKCGHRTVLLFLAARGDDFYRCHYRGCGWEVYADPEHWDRDGRAQLAAYETVNGGPR